MSIDIKASRKIHKESYVCTNCDITHTKKSGCPLCLTEIEISNLKIEIDYLENENSDLLRQMKRDPIQMGNSPE